MNRLFIVPILMLIFSLAATNIGAAKPSDGHKNHRGRYEHRADHSYKGHDGNPGHHKGHWHQNNQENHYGRFNRHGHQRNHDYHSGHYYGKAYGNYVPLFYVIPGFIGASVFFGY
jgi:hypothetical protein